MLGAFEADSESVLWCFGYLPVRAEIYFGYFALNPPEQAAKLFRLKLLENKRRKGNRGFALECGFPLKLLSSCKEKTRRLEIPYVVIAETGYDRQGLKRRE